MRLCYKLLLLNLILPFAVWSQSFSVSFPDTIAYGPAIDSSALSCWTNDLVTNLTSQVITLDVVRVENVAVTGWNTAFCFQICSQPTVDSIRATMGPNEVVNVAFHFMINGVPDSGTAVLKFKNVNNPSEVYYQRFYGISQSTASVGSYLLTAPVTLYPNPARQGSEIYLNIAGKEACDLIISDASGKVVERRASLAPGTNSFTTTLTAGIYFYSMVSPSRVFTGRLVIVGANQD
ncbi:MAG: T9SS type A sorting domain-containing protein [Bacteroidia bacterium]|nr:T9SS type A sorting domain-containing protein [Bacteroidia bacterium]